MNISNNKHSGKSAVWCMDHRGREYTFEQFVECALEFHGYSAPGLIIGGAMVASALSGIGKDVIFDAVCETGSCLPDAVQILTQCTIGNGWLKIIDSGRFALTLYNKSNGEGVRVCIDPEKLGGYPEIKNWFLKLTPRSEQKPDKILDEIKSAGDDLFKVTNVAVDHDGLKKKHLGKIVFCPDCGEAYPAKAGSSCSFCGGEKYFNKR